MARVYATSSQYTEYTGEAAPTDIDVRLARASDFLEARIFRFCLFDVDGDGYPSNALVAEAFAKATCAQVQWGVDVGDITGAAGVGWSKVQLGTARLERSDTVKTGDQSAARQIAPAAWDPLGSSDLTPDILWIGAVMTC
ncbi:hypothetical protein [Streptomyces sp. NPDC101115]|uniref:hypothetical protein n=1 Tax=Streptomyces sp. NPDC101115 TaxID=3366106 RepID=UPI0037F17325